MHYNKVALSRAITQARTLRCLTPWRRLSTARPTESTRRCKPYRQIGRRLSGLTDCSASRQNRQRPLPRPSSTPRCEKGSQRCQRQREARSWHRGWRANARLGRGRGRTRAAGYSGAQQYRRRSLPRRPRHPDARHPESCLVLVAVRPRLRCPGALGGRGGPWCPLHYHPGQAAPRFRHAPEVGCAARVVA